MTARSRITLVVIWCFATVATLIYLVASAVSQWGASDTYAEDPSQGTLSDVLGRSGNTLAGFILLVILVVIGYLWDPVDTDEEPQEVEEEPVAPVVQLRPGNQPFELDLENERWEPDLDQLPTDVATLIEDMRQAQQ